MLFLINLWNSLISSSVSLHLYQLHNKKIIPPHVILPLFILLIDAIKEIKSKILSTQSKRVRRRMTVADSQPSRIVKPASLAAGGNSIVIKIYGDDSETIDRAWEEFNRKTNAKIKGITTDRNIDNDVIKKFTDPDFKRICELERAFDVRVKVDQNEGNVNIRGHIDDISSTQEEILKLFKDVNDRESKGKILTH